MLQSRLLAPRRRRRQAQGGCLLLVDVLKVDSAVEDVVEHAEEVSLPEDDVTVGAPEAVEVEYAVSRLHD